MNSIRQNEKRIMVGAADSQDCKDFARGRRRTMMNNVNIVVCGVSSLVYCLGSLPGFCMGFVGPSSSSSSPVAFVSSSSSSTSSRCCSNNKRYRRSKVCVGIYAPPNSGYTEPDEEESSFYPDTYQPMMAYPGTMRPGTTPENQPFATLPIQDNDPDPVPWPHFQEIEWHHQWGSPHEHAIPMEEFIELEGRWATAEEEAAMRAGVRRNVRERRELEEAEKGSTSLILDDDDDDDDIDDDMDDDKVKIDLGEGVRSVLQATTALPNQKQSTTTSQDDDDDDDDDDFLLDLGLDSDDLEEDDDDQEGKDNGDEPAFPTGGDSPEELLNAMQSMIDAAGSHGDTDDDDDDDDDGIDNDDDDDYDGIDDDDDDDLNIDLGLLDLDDNDDDDDAQTNDDDDDLNMFDEDDDKDDQMVPLDDMIGSEDSDENGDSFDDGGFDYDDFDNDNDGGDMY